MLSLLLQRPYDVVTCFVLHSYRERRSARLLATAKIGYKNTQKKVTINKSEVLLVTENLRKALKVETFCIDIWFCSEARIRDLNYEHRGINKSTDVLSFPANDFEAPETFLDDPSMHFERHLGDLVIAPSYVQQQCREDEQLFRNNELDVSEDAGVSREMATVFDVQRRIPFLIVHGILHLLGYVLFYPLIILDVWPIS